MPKRKPPTFNQRPVPQPARVSNSGAVALTLPQAMQEAVAAWQRGNWTEAERLCRLMIDAKAGFLDALNLLGIITAQTQRAQEAAELFLRLVSASPNNAEAHSNLGNALFELKRYEEAVASYDRALQIEPEYAEALCNRGTALRDLKRFEEALASYDRALRIRPDYAEAHYNRGIALREMNRIDDALAGYDRALANPSSEVCADDAQPAASDEVGRRKRVIADGRTDLARWADPGQLESAWEARAVAAADLIAAGARVLDIGCGAMKLERHLPFGCRYLPADVVARDPRTVVADLNADGMPERALADCDLIVMLGVWEYLYRPEEVFAAFARAGKPVLCSYCDTGSTAHLDRRALGWVNDFSQDQFLALARRHGYQARLVRRVDALQQLYKFTLAPGPAARNRRRAHVISYNNVGNFGDRLGFHLLNDILPAHAEVSWGTLRPFTPVPRELDLLVVGIGNSLFGDLLDDQLIRAAAGAKASIGVFGTQYRQTLPANRLGALLDSLTHWYARYEEDINLYARGRSNVSHLGDWLINAFPMAVASDERLLVVGQEIWNNLPLDRTIQSIQGHRKVLSTRLHPLLCALTSAREVAYREQREGANAGAVSGKFRSMLIDVFGETFPEEKFWTVDRTRVAAYKARVRDNTDVLKAHIAALLA